MEEVIVEDGINLPPSFAPYLTPGAADVPDVEPIVVEAGEGLGPFGARGIGEPPIGPPAAAVANAVADATGARLTRLPLTAERVAAALGLLPRQVVDGASISRPGYDERSLGHATAALHSWDAPG